MPRRRYAHDTYTVFNRGLRDQRATWSGFQIFETREEAAASARLETKRIGHLVEVFEYKEREHG